MLCCCCLVAKLCPTLCSSLGYSMPGFSVLQQLLEFVKFLSTELVMLCNYLILCVSKTKSAWPSKENSLIISCVMNLFGSSLISSSCLSSSFLWASNSIRSSLVSCSCGTQQGVQWSCPLADLALALHWGSLSCWKPLWIPQPPSQIHKNFEQTAGKSSGFFHGDGPTSYSAKTLVRSLGQEDPLEEGMATHSSILAWRIPWTEAPGGVQPIVSQAVRHYWNDLAEHSTGVTVLPKFLQGCFWFVTDLYWPDKKCDVNNISWKPL